MRMFWGFVSYWSLPKCVSEKKQTVAKPLATTHQYFVVYSTRLPGDRWWSHSHLCNTCWPRYSETQTYQSSRAYVCVLSAVREVKTTEDTSKKTVSGIFVAWWKGNRRPHRRVLLTDTSSIVFLDICPSQRDTAWKMEPSRRLMHIPHASCWLLFH